MPTNNTGKSQPRMEEAGDRKIHPSAIISFNQKISNWKGYALSALNKTIEKYSLRITNKAELVEQLLYSLTNKEQIKDKG